MSPSDMNAPFRAVLQPEGLSFHTEATGYRTPPGASTREAGDHHCRARSAQSREAGNHICRARALGATPWVADVVKDIP